MIHRLRGLTQIVSLNLVIRLWFVNELETKAKPNGIMGWPAEQLV